MKFASYLCLGAAAYLLVMMPPRTWQPGDAVLFWVGLAIYLKTWEG